METRCHQLLSSFRVSQNREFFKITVDEVISILSPHFRTEEEIVLEKIRAQKRLDAEKHQREQIRQQRLKDKKRRQKEQLEQKIEYLSVSINRLNSDVSKIEALLSKPESITSRFLSKVQDGLIFILIVFCARVAPFALAILGLLSGEEFIQKLLLAAGFYVVGIFATMLFSAISIAVISLIERLRSYVFGESHNQLREMLSEKANELNNKSIELNRLKS